MPTTSVGSHAQCAFHYDPRVPVLDNDPQGRKRKCGKCGEATQPGQRVANHVGDRCRRFKVLESMKLVWCFGCLADFVRAHRRKLDGYVGRAQMELGVAWAGPLARQARTPAARTQRQPSLPSSLWGAAAAAAPIQLGCGPRALPAVPADKDRLLAIFLAADEDEGRAVEQHHVLHRAMLGNLEQDKRKRKRAETAVAAAARQTPGLPGSAAAMPERSGGFEWKGEEAEDGEGERRTGRTGARGTVNGGGGSGPVAPAAPGAWACTKCTLLHAAPAQADYLSCTMCGSERQRPTGGAAGDEESPSKRRR